MDHQVTPRTTQVRRTTALISQLVDPHQSPPTDRVVGGVGVVLGDGWAWARERRSARVELEEGRKQAGEGGAGGF